MQTDSVTYINPIEGLERSNVIQQVRHATGLSAAEIAQHLRISARTWALWEAGALPHPSKIHYAYYVLDQLISTDAAMVYGENQQPLGAVGKNQMISYTHDSKTDLHSVYYTAVVTKDRRQYVQQLMMVFKAKGNEKAIELFKQWRVTGQMSLSYA